jgi:hypothetical protein
MARTPTRVLLLSAEPCQASYVETVLEMEAPGRFRVCRGDGDAPIEEGCDVCILALDAGAPVDATALRLLPLDPAAVPTIAVAPWMPDVADVHALMRHGADDVLGLAELSPRRLVSAIVKALERQARRPAAAREAVRSTVVAGIDVRLPGTVWASATASLMEAGEAAAGMPCP